MRASPTAATMVTPPRCAAFTRATQGSGSPLMFASARPSMAKAASSSLIPPQRPRPLRPSSNGRTNPRSSSRRPADVVIQQELGLLPERWFGDPAPDRPDLAADTLTSSANPPARRSARLRHHVEQSRLAAFYHRDRPPQRRAEILRIIDRPLGIHPHTLCQFRKIHIRVGECRADPGPVDSAIVPVGHPLHVHQLFVIRPIIVHDAQQRNAMMRRRPQHRRHKHKIAVILNTHREAALLPVRQRRAQPGRRVVSNAAAALPADVLVLLVETPEPYRPPI